jgi:hypothetical protein
MDAYWTTSPPPQASLASLVARDQYFCFINHPSFLFIQAFLNFTILRKKKLLHFIEYICISFSNRCFWTKAISIWTSTGDADHVMIVGSYFHYSGGFEPPQVILYSLHRVFGNDSWCVGFVLNCGSKREKKYTYT